MVSSRSFIASGLMFKSLIHFELIFVLCKIRVQYYSFTCGYSVFLAPFVEEITFSPLGILGTLVENQLIVYAWAYFWALCSAPLVYMFVFMPVPYCFD